MTLKTQLFILSFSMGALIIIVFDIVFYASVKKNNHP